MKQQKYAVRANMIIKNTRSGETIRGSIVDVQTVDSKLYWVVVPDNRPNQRLLFAQDAWNVMKGN
jgi:hypothetical protein